MLVATYYCFGLAFRFLFRLGTFRSIYVCKSFANLNLFCARTDGGSSESYIELLIEGSDP